MASLDREHGCGRSQERGRGRQTTYVMKKTVRDVGSVQYPMLTFTNYAEWVVLMNGDAQGETPVGSGDRGHR